jgi:hypothetical protein
MFESIFGQWGTAVMDVLLLVSCLFVALVFATFSCARSYFEKGRRSGIEEAIRELIRGVNSHCVLEQGAEPEPVAIALKGLKTFFWKASNPGNGFGNPYHAQLWRLGDALGEACWLKGHAAGLRRRAPPEGKIRVDLSLNELLQLSWLAHLGFQHMMPNYRGFEIHRFSGEEDAQEGARAVSKIECAIPMKERPFADLSDQLKHRQELISSWWLPVQPNRLSA